MISIINASPRTSSNSNYFINLVTKKIKDNYTINKLYKDDINNVITNIKEANTILFVFPLYVDAPPSKLLELMENYNNDKKVYMISNCGFLESKHNNIAVKIIENWSNNHFMGSFKIGAGEVLGHDNILSKILSPLFKHKMFKFTKSINKNKKISLSATLLIPKRMFCYFANKSFKEKIKLSKKKGNPS